MFPGGVKGGPVYNAPVTAAVLRSQGTQFLGMTIWNDLNSGWQNYGTTPVEIDYTSLAGSITPQALAATNADVLIISTAGFDYADAEAAAIIDYVEAGHGLIITYATFAMVDFRTTRNSDLAPLVGLSETISPGTNTWPNPIEFDLSDPNHPIFAGVTGPYETGVPFMVSPFPGTDWDLTMGSILARATPSVPSFTGNGPIIANETQLYRSVYFSHYIENKSDGSNAQDAQLFYNALTWTGAVPEPGTLMLLGCGFGGLWVMHGHGAIAFARRVRCTA
jgi:hypothetical protein